MQTVLLNSIKSISLLCWIWIKQWRSKRI